MADASNISLNERMTFLQLIFHNIWTEVRKQEGIRKQLFVFSKGKQICCLSPGGAILYKKS